MPVGLRPSLSLELGFDDINTAIIRLKEKVSINSDTKRWCYNLNLENSRGRNGSDKEQTVYLGGKFTGDSPQSWRLEAHLEKGL